MTYSKYHSYQLSQRRKDATLNGFLLMKILAVTDGSQPAVLAAHAAADLSPRAKAQLHMVHVWQEPCLAMTLPAVATDEYSRAFVATPAVGSGSQGFAAGANGSGAGHWGGRLEELGDLSEGLAGGKRVREVVDASSSVG